MRRLTLLTVCGLAVTLSPSLARAWGGDGHRIVCAIAWDELRAVTRKRVQSLLDIQTREQFADICNWADEYRPTHLETAPWHFVNVPKGATSVDVERDCKEPRSCAVAQIDRQADILKSSASKEDRAMALKFIGHFVGDIHQPLHAGYAEDRGGNRIRGEFMGKKMDMHELWDTALIASKHRPWSEIARSLRSKVTARKRGEWNRSTPNDWANEALTAALSSTIQYGDQSKGFVWGADYARENMPVVHERLTQAGVRLGHLLNDTLR